MKIEFIKMKLKCALLLLVTLFYTSIGNAQNYLDKITGLNSTTASVAYSLRQLSSSYSGPLVRVKVGASFYDVYPDVSTTKFSLISKISAAIGTYDAGVAAASTNALSTIISGSTDATVAIWYDQSGNGVHVLSNTSTAKIITAGSINTLSGQPTVYFSGNTSKLGSSSTVDYSALSGATVNAVAQNTATTSGYAGIIGAATAGTYPGYNISYASGLGYQSDGDGCGYRTSVNSTDPKIVTNIFINNTTNLSKIYINNELKTNVAVTSGTCALSHTSGSKIFIGVSRGLGSTSTFIGNISEAIIFPSQLSDAIRNPLETNQTAFYFAPSVSITSSASGAVCAGTNITFTAVASNISTPTYQWYKNGAVISGETNATYITSSLANADQIYVTATPGYTSGSISTSNLIANFDAANYNTSSTRWYDLSTSANHMDFYTSFNYTTLKTATYSSEGGGSLNVNNNNVYGRTINNTGITGNGAKTMSVWVKFDAADRDWTDIANFGSFAGWAQLFEMFGSRNGSGYQIFLIYSGSVVAGATTIPLNTWAYITISADGPSIKIYVNGILDGSANQALSTVNSPLYLGNSSSTSNYDNLRGKISTLSLWNSALSGQTILDNYNATKARYAASAGYTSNIITSSINASPAAPTITVTGDGCSNKTILTRSTALGTYAWYKDNVAITGVTSNTYTPTVAGDYHVQVTSGSCSTNSTATTIFNCGNNAFGKMVALTNASSIISLEGGANFGTGKDISGKIYNTTSFTTTSGTIGSTTAVLGGVISTTNAVTSSIGIMYSTDANFGTYSTTTIQSNVTAGTYTSTISGLSSSTNYHAKSFIVNKAGTSYGSVVSFTTAAAPVTVGSVYGGGIVFYILQSGDNGYDANVQHGLIAPFNSISRQSTNPLPPIVESQIGLNAATISGATSDGTLLGKTNTDAIIANQGSTGTYAALYCRNYANPASKTFNSVAYTFPVYNDWYMPSIVELNKFRAYVWSLHPSRGSYTNYGGTLIYYNGTSGNGNDYAWGKYLSSTMTGQRYKLYYLESGNEDGSAAYNGWTESDRLVVMPIRSF